MMNGSRLGAVVVVLGGTVPSQILAQAEEPGGTFEVAVGGGLSASPLGNIAERHGTFLVPGRHYEGWLTYRTSRKTEVGVGMLTEGYNVDQVLDSRTRSRFEYTSTGVFGGLSWVEAQGPTPIRYGIDLGWRWFSVESNRPNYYTGEPSGSWTNGRAVALGLGAGVELPLDFATAIPRVRVETSYPSFAGGDGYTNLRKARDVGFRVSVGIQGKSAFKPGKERRSPLDRE